MCFLGWATSQPLAQCWEENFWAVFRKAKSQDDKQWSYEPWHGIDVSRHGGTAPNQTGCDLLEMTLTMLLKPTKTEFSSIFKN